MALIILPYAFWRPLCLQLRSELTRKGKKQSSVLLSQVRHCPTIRVLCKQLSDSASDGSPHRQGVLQKTLGKPRLRDLEIIAIDEIYAGRRNKFFTIVIDWRSGAIVYVGTGKGQDALNPFWKLLRGSGAKKKAVSTDMSSAYHAAVVKHLPQAKQVFDRFHLVKLMNEKLTQRRRDLQREAETMNRKVLTGTRWPLIKHPCNLDESKNERVRLQEHWT